MKFIKHKSKQNRPVLLHERLSYAEIIALSVYSAGNSMEQGNIISIQPEMTLVEARSIISNSLKVGKRKAVLLERENSFAEDMLSKLKEG